MHARDFQIKTRNNKTARPQTSPPSRRVFPDAAHSLALSRSIGQLPNRSIIIISIHHTCLKSSIHSPRNGVMIRNSIQVRILEGLGDQATSLWVIAEGHDLCSVYVLC